MTSEIKNRLKQLEQQLNQPWEEIPPPDSLSVSLWEFSATLDSLTDEEQEKAAAELGISVESLSELKRHFRKPKHRWKHANFKAFNRATPNRSQVHLEV